MKLQKKFTGEIHEGNLHFLSSVRTAEFLLLQKSAKFFDFLANGSLYTDTPKIWNPFS